MPKEVSLGHYPTNKRDFGEESLPLLQFSQQDIFYLLNRGYDLVHAVTFVGNRFQFSARQRTALTRATCPGIMLKRRQERLVTSSIPGETMYIDGFNLVITLEAVLSPETTLLRCMDGTVRDLCGLHGTYRIIGATQTALEWIGAELQKLLAGAAVFYLDAPVSNSGRLRAEILEAMGRAGLPCEVYFVPNADAELRDRELVVSSDGIVLDRCKSWLNLAGEIIDSRLPERRVIYLTDRA